MSRHRRPPRPDPPSLLPLLVAAVVLTQVWLALATGHTTAPADTATTVGQPRLERPTAVLRRATRASYRPPLPPPPKLDIISAIARSGGRYVWAGASLQQADCSGLVSVALSLAMGKPPHRIGDTHSLLAGQWPGAIRGATPADKFVIGTSPSHMVARINGVNIESRSRGMPYLIGDAAKSPWDHEFTQVYHIDPALLVALA